MANKRLVLPLSDVEGNFETSVGKTVLIYDTYANALAFGSTGLLDNARVFELDRLTDAKGDAVTQSKGGTLSACGTGAVTPDVGLSIDVDGNLVGCIDDNGGAVTEVFLASETGNGRQPRRVDVSALDTTAS